MSPTIHLLVTGKTEQLGLADSLMRVFPAEIRPVKSLEFAEPQGFTSARVRPFAELSALERMESTLVSFAKTLVAEVCPGRTGTAPDLVVGIDDLELVNADQPEQVARTLRDAVCAHVEANWSGSRRERVYASLRERCSFHLLRPMVEAYFFGEAAALVRAGRAEGRTSRFSCEDCDPELFSVGMADDPDYHAIPEPPRTDTQRRSIKRKEKSDWRRNVAVRARHPKKYVQFLCDALGDGNSSYSEATGGAHALRHLAWQDVMRRAEQVAYAQALFVDIAQLVAPRPEYGFLRERTPVCATWPPPRDHVLRNL
jgi:hypothetical protein